MNRLIPVFIFAGICGQADPAFDASIRAVDNGGGAISTISADLDNNGTFEFISAASRNSADPHLRIYEWNRGGFTAHDVLPSSTVQSLQDRFGGDLSVADIDGDGLKDIIVPESNNGSGPGKVSWFKNPGTLGGAWTEVIVSTWSGNGIGDIAEHMSDIAVGDIDGDGQQDIVVRDVSHGFWVLIQISGGNNWHPRKFVPANPREGLALWDPDTDGDLDVLLNGVWFETPSDPVNGDYFQRTIIGAEAWYPSSTTGDAINDYACQVEAGYFNRDGRIDFVISNAEKLANAPSTASKPLGVRVYLSPIDPVNGTWREVVLHTNYFSWHNCEVGDIDGDGALDVVSGISQVGVEGISGLMMAFLNDGSGKAFTQQPITSEYVYNSSIGDADGDGDLDFFAPENWNSGPIRYLKNTTAPGPKLQIDYKGDNVVLSWLANFSSYRLQSAPTFNGGSSNWTTYPGPYTKNGGKIVVTNKIGPNRFRQGFYRLTQ